MMQEYIENMFLLTNQICWTMNVSNQLGFPHMNVINLLVNNQKSSQWSRREKSNYFSFLVIAVILKQENQHVKVGDNIFKFLLHWKI